MLAVSSLVSLVSLGCLIYILTKMYPKEGLLKTIFGFICGLYALIWGWQNINNYDANFKNVVYVFTGAAVVAVIVNGMLQASQ
jgi:peptidoglycan/LPS O-acetylase OafA/YrhL